MNRVLAILLVLLTPIAARAHAVVYPPTAPPGAYQRYVLRVPNERDVDTVRIAIDFPAAVTVVSFEDVPGWNLEIRRDRGRIVGAVWTGKLSPERFVELPFVAVDPQAGERLEWPVDQTYAGGEVVAWRGPEGSETPASTTRVEPLDGLSTAWPLGLAGGALLVSLLSLGLTLRHRTPA